MQSNTPPRWSFNFEEKKFKEEPFNAVSRLDSLKRALLFLFGLSIGAFALGLILASFCVGTYIAVDWLKEFIK